VEPAEWIALAAVIVSPLAGVLTVALSGRVNRRTERGSRLDEMRLDLYLDVYRFVRTIGAQRSVAIDDTDLEVENQLGARVYLLASWPVRDHWQRMWSIQDSSARREFDFLEVRHLIHEMRAEVIRDLESDRRLMHRLTRRLR
jgi:hypothetical protein